MITHAIHANKGYQDADCDVEHGTGDEDVVFDAKVMEAKRSSFDAEPEEERENDACGDDNAEEAFLGAVGKRLVGAHGFEGVLEVSGSLVGRTWGAVEGSVMHIFATVTSGT